MKRITISFLVAFLFCSNLYAFDVDQYKDYPKLHNILKRELTKEKFLNSPAGKITLRKLNRNYLSRNPRAVNRQEFNRPQFHRPRADNSYSYRDDYNTIDHAFEGAYKEWQEIRGSKIIEYVLPFLLF